MRSAPANAEAGPPARELWQLVRAGPQIDPRQLAAAVREAAGYERLDYRTRLLIRDSLLALEQFWGKETLTAWLKASPTAEHLAKSWNAIA